MVKLSPGIPRVAGDLVKTRKVGANSPRTAARLCHVFGHFEGAGQLWCKDGGVDRRERIILRYISRISCMRSLLSRSWSDDNVLRIYVAVSMWRSIYTMWPYRCEKLLGRDERRERQNKILSFVFSACFLSVVRNDVFAMWEGGTPGLPGSLHGIVQRYITCRSGWE